MSFTKKFGVVIQERVPTGKLKIQKLVDGAWVTTGFAPDFKSAERHAKAVGGSVRVLAKGDEVVAMFGVQLAPTGDTQ